ncbi:MAG: flagellar hook-associated protein FlgK [Thermanaeromonas sp.]|nr:flagellar hook-associated protein FlgK [Thermanaeromonas sp.]
MAHQKAMQTTAHNIANASTEGYTRQRVVMVPTPAYPVPAMSRPGGQGWQVGTGVDVQEVRRIRDEFLDQQIRKETGTLGQWEQIQYVLQQVEVVFNEPSDTGLSTLMSQFWAAWQELSKNAESLPVRRTVIETANALAEAFRHSAAQLNQLKNDIDKSIELKVQEVNSIAQQIADLNGQIKNIIAAGDQPNDLMDRRDLLLDRLSKIVKINVVNNDDGTINVTLDGAPSGALSLINSTSYNNLFMAKTPANEIKLGIIENNSLLDKDKPIDEINGLSEETRYKIEFTPNGVNLYDSNNSPVASASSSQGVEVALKDRNNEPKLTIITVTPLPTSGDVEFEILNINNGEIKGLLKGREYVDSYLASLNTLAQELARAINAQHQGGLGIGDTTPTPRPFFVDSDNSDSTTGITASNIYIYKDLIEKPMHIAAAAIIDPQLGYVTELGGGLVSNNVYRIKYEYDSSTSEDIVTLEKLSDGNWVSVGDSKSIKWDGTTPVTVGTNTETITFTPRKYTTTKPPYGNYIVNWPAPAPGDASNALAIAQLQSTVIEGLGSTFDDYYKNFIAKLGVDAHEAERMTTNQGVLVTQLTNRRESISGVSIDEEMAYMIQFLRGYEAAARLMTTLDEMLDVLINRMAVH